MHSAPVTEPHCPAVSLAPTSRLLLTPTTDSQAARHSIGEEPIAALASSEPSTQPMRALPEPQQWSSAAAAVEPQQAEQREPQPWAGGLHPAALNASSFHQLPPQLRPQAEVERVTYEGGSSAGPQAEREAGPWASPASREHDRDEWGDEEDEEQEDEEQQEERRRRPRDSTSFQPPQRAEEGARCG
jgi:hypothetical protein